MINFLNIEVKKILVIVIALNLEYENILNVYNCLSFLWL